MAFLFGSNPTVADMARRYKSEIARQTRELERENMKLQMEERGLFREIKKHAQTNPALAFQKAKAVVRTRRIARRFGTMVSNLQGIQAKISSIKSMDALNKTMQSVTELMTRFNSTPALANMHQTMARFARENQSVMMKTEMMDENLEEIFDENEDEECSELVADVMTEAGVELPVPQESLEERFEKLKVKIHI